MSPPRIVETRTFFRGWNRLDILTVEATDSRGERVRYAREVIDHGDGCVVLVIDRRREVAILVRQWRAPLLVGDGDPFLLEACAGIIDPGETPEAAARREAAEEIGYRLSTLHKVAVVASSAGSLTERMHLYIAEVSAADRMSDGGGNPHEGETLEVVEISLADLFGMARRGDILDAKTLILVQHLLIETLERGPA